jgi:hypothetical protein
VLLRTSQARRKRVLALKLIKPMTAGRVKSRQ